MKYHPAAPAGKANPYPYYADLRAQTPAYHLEDRGWPAISRYADVDFILKNPKLFSSATMFASFFGDMDPLPDSPSLIASDPPVHTRLRKLVNKAFTPKLIRAIKPHIRTITQDLLAHVAGQIDIDFVRDLTLPLPVIVIAEMLGVPPQRCADFRRWSDDPVPLRILPIRPKKSSAFKPAWPSSGRISRP